jgi:hypothetical protein
MNICTKFIFGLVRIKASAVVAVVMLLGGVGLPLSTFAENPIVSHVYTYEQGSIVITTNRVFKDWPQIFNDDTTLTSALLDRLLHHTEAIVVEGKSYRMKDVVKD